MLLENHWQEDKFQSYGEIESTCLFEFTEDRIMYLKLVRPTCEYAEQVMFRTTT